MDLELEPSLVFLRFFSTLRLTSFDITKINYDETIQNHPKNHPRHNPGLLSPVRTFPFNKEHILCARIGRLVKHKYK